MVDKENNGDENIASLKEKAKKLDESTETLKHVTGLMGGLLELEESLGEHEAALCKEYMRFIEFRLANPEASDGSLESNVRGFFKRGDNPKPMMCPSGTEEYTIEGDPPRVLCPNNPRHTTDLDKVKKWQCYDNQERIETAIEFYMMTEDNYPETIEMLFEKVPDTAPHCPSGDIAYALTDDTPPRAFCPNEPSHNDPQEFYEGKVLLWSRAAQAQPDDASIAYKVGFYLHKLDRDEDALDWITKAVTLAPDNSTYYHGQGVVYNNLGRQNEAETCFAKEDELKREEEKEESE